METIVLIITILLTSLSAGVLFCFSTAINGALHRLKDREYIRAMQHIDTVIQNPVFLLTFSLPVALLPFVAFAYGDGIGSFKFILFAIASLFYIIGTFGVTVRGNVPLNERLHGVDLEGSDSDVNKARGWYEAPWNRLHAVRNISGIISVIALVWAALL